MCELTLDAAGLKRDPVAHLRPPAVRDLVRRHARAAGLTDPADIQRCVDKALATLADGGSAFSAVSDGRDEIATVLAEQSMDRILARDVEKGGTGSDGGAA